MTKLLIATHNEGKLTEVKLTLSSLPFHPLTLRDFPNIIPIDETASSFAGNASLKASGYALQTRVLTLADDSGLEVEGLGGAPGVRSSRYGGEGASDLERIERLLSQLADKNNRRARFVTAIAIADPGGVILYVSTGTCEGLISEAPRGQNGFGYDPIFIPNSYDLTFAELGLEKKIAISHRARALAQARDYLMSLTRELAAG